MQVGFKGFHISKDKQDIKIPFLHCGQEYQLAHGSLVIAAVISCTNNCNPSVMLTAGRALSQKIKLIRCPLKIIPNFICVYTGNAFLLNFHILNCRFKISASLYFLQCDHEC